MASEASAKSEDVYRLLETRIRTGDWPVGEIIPTEAELVAQFGCGRSTVGKALARLAHEGLVERRRRAGTRVVRNASNRTTNTPVVLDAFAFIYPSNIHESIWRTVNGFQDAAHAAGRRTLTLTTAAEHQKDVEMFSRLAEFDVKGAVIYPSLSTAQEHVHFGQILLASKVPVVLTVNFPGLGFPSVVVDGFHAAYTMTRHLISRGARHIGFLANGAWSLHMRDRHLGYLWALEEAGLPVPPDGVLLEPAMHPNFRDPIEEPKRIAKTLLDRAKNLDAVMCANDFLAVGLTAAALAAGRTLPDDLLIAGIDDLAIAATSEVALTTYHVPFEERGRIAFRCLEDLLAGRELPCHETRVRGEIVLRRSS